jgi:hypothetical protein
MELFNLLSIVFGEFETTKVNFKAVESIYDPGLSLQLLYYTK